MAPKNFTDLTDFISRLCNQNASVNRWWWLDCICNTLVWLFLFLVIVPIVITLAFMVSVPVMIVVYANWSQTGLIALLLLVCFAFGSWAKLIKDWPQLVKSNPTVSVIAIAVLAIVIIVYIFWSKIGLIMLFVLVCFGFYLWVRHTFKELKAEDYKPASVAIALAIATFVFVWKYLPIMCLFLYII